MHAVPAACGGLAGAICGCGRCSEQQGARLPRTAVSPTEELCPVFGCIGGIGGAHPESSDRATAPGLAGGGGAPVGERNSSMSSFLSDYVNFIAVTSYDRNSYGTEHEFNSKCIYLMNYNI